MNASDQTILLWASSREFALQMIDALHGSTLRWASFSDILDLAGLSPGKVGAFLLDGKHLKAHMLVRWLRSTETWKDTRIILVGGAPEPEDPKTVCLPVVNRNTDLEHALEAPTVHHELPQDAYWADKRLSFRHPCHCKSEIGLDVEIVDISEGGAQLAVPFAMPEGIELRINLQSFSQEFDHPVRFHVLKVRPAAPPETGFRVHGKFERLTTVYQRALRRVLMNAQVLTRQPHGTIQVKA